MPLDVRSGSGEASLCCQVPEPSIPPQCRVWARSPPGALASFQKVCLCSEPCLQHPSPKVCREYQRGNCNRGENDCRFAHPADSAMIDTNDNTVTVCMDYIKGRCSREKCKYFHPPAHLQAKIKAAQYQVNQAAAAQAAATAAAMVSVGALLDVDVH
ncbi:hypothetical protein DV515_00013210 [Chloebia gouldiae]|uniref:C3H1-type domain-containing protein n=1 Tax=Chloebia gouldiae TaxID=44316 RepID=A0A3L8S1R6_CHLGU|nr:hypothetical protein DV515_00013210 [Chloebia gouldiae]